MEPAAESSARSELEARAASTPEAPFLFFREPRGHFGWWSWARCRRESLSASPAGPTETIPRELLEALAGASEEDRRRGEALAAAAGPGRRRDVWLSARPLDRPAELALACAALAGGWAVVRDPGEGVPASTFAWARPTLASGSPPELDELTERLGAMAPRWGARRWLSRRLRRLRLVWVEGDDADPGPWRERFASLGAEARVVCFPPGRW